MNRKNSNYNRDEPIHANLLETVSSSAICAGQTRNNSKPYVSSTELGLGRGSARCHVPKFHTATRDMVVDMMDHTTRDTAARTVAGWLKGDGETDPSTPTIIDLLGQLGVSGNDASLAVQTVRALLVPDPLDRASTVPMTVTDVIAALSHWPQHAVLKSSPRLKGGGFPSLTEC